MNKNSISNLPGKVHRKDLLDPLPYHVTNQTDYLEHLDPIPTHTSVLLPEINKGTTFLITRHLNNKLFNMIFKFKT
jgi:hypothetical protein